MTDRTTAHAAPPEEPDLLYGAKAIAQFLGITVAQARHLYEVRRIPTFKIGWIVCARRSSLQDWLDRMEEQAWSTPDSEMIAQDG